MAHPGRPRGRMNKKTLQAQAASQAEQLARVQQQQAQQQAQRAAQAQMGNNPNSQQSIKEETGVQLHDEADLISFRNDALLRYITNHEYIENVMSKLIHSSKIIPPSLYPLIPKINEYENLKPEDVYFGDLEAMKYVEKKLAERSDNMKENQILLMLSICLTMKSTSINVQVWPNYQNYRMICMIRIPLINWNPS